jgi:peptide chain release factor 1
MKESLRLRLDQLCDRHEELEALLADVEVISDNKRFRNLSREHNDLSEITDVWKKYKQAEEDIETAEAMLTDPDFKDMAVEEIKENKALIEQLEAELNILMIPKDPNDANSAYLEIRAGTGGDEAAIFSGDLFRMYSKYAESQNWRIEVLSENEGEHGGYKEIICFEW